MGGARLHSPQSSDTYRRSEPPNLKQPVVDHRKQHPAAVATDMRKPARSCSKHVEARLNLSSFDHCGVFRHSSWPFPPVRVSMGRNIPHRSKFDNGDRVAGRVEPAVARRQIESTQASARTLLLRGFMGLLDLAQRLHERRQVHAKSSPIAPRFWRHARILTES